jgi:hypothetical protein
MYKLVFRNACFVFLRRIFNVMSLLVLVVVFQDSFLFAQLSENDLYLIDFLIQKNRENTETIRNWSGTGIYEETHYSDVTSKENRKKKMKFSFTTDVVKNRRWGYSKTSIDYYTISESKIQNNPLEIYGLMIDKEVIYRYQARDITGTAINNEVIDNVTYFRGTLVLSEVNQFKLDKGNFKDNIDPFYCFQFAGDSPESYFSLKRNYLLKMSPQRTETLLRDGDLITLRSEAKVEDGKLLLHEYTVDVSKGGSFTKCKSSQTGVYETLWISEVEKISGVWVPKKLVETSGFGKYRTEIVFMEQRVNEPIDNLTFTLKSLGVRNGDALIDMRTGEHSVINDNSLPEFELPDMRRKSFGYTRITLITLGLVLILIAIFMKWRQWSKSKTKENQSNE